MNENKRNLNIEELDKVAGGQITPEEAFETALKHAKKKKGSVRNIQI